MKFVIYCLPRSRSFWLSRFLTYGDWTCDHDEIRHLRTLDDLQSWLKLPNTGTVETAAAPFWRLARDLKTITIRRPVHEVMQSLIATGLPWQPDLLLKTLHHLNSKLDQIEHRVPNVLSIPYHELQSEAVCRDLFEHCLPPYRHDPAWWQVMDRMNLQINLGQMTKYFQAYQQQLSKMAKLAKHETLTRMQLRHEDVSDDGVVIREETLASGFADAIELFADHAVLVGEAPDAVLDKNIGLIERLEQNGAIQIITARQNGRMFGYLMSVIAPSLESAERLSALQTTFYASPLIKGLGLRLQRESVKALAAKGVHEVCFHAGVRGAGPRLGTIYRRLGASEYGQMFRMALNNGTN